MKSLRIFSIFLLFTLLLSSCSANSVITEKELSMIENPSPENNAWLDAVVPKLISFFIEQETRLLLKGTPLSNSMADVAKRIGIKHFDKVRIVFSDNFPLPDDELLIKELKKLGLGSIRVGGFSMGYAILIKPEHRNKNWLLIHELVHVLQRERLGTEKFIKRYLMELRIVGYKRSPLENEANRIMQNFR